MRVLPLALFALALTSLAAAQDPDPAAARTRANRTVDCLERVQNDLGTTMRLLREAARQTQSRDAAAARDAVQMVVSLEQRVADLSRAMKACVPEDALLQPRTVVQDRTGSEAAVAEANDIPVVERDATLAPHVKAVIGQRVDGTGTVSHAVVKASIRGVSSRLERCYTRLANRQAGVQGQLDLAFTISTRGDVRNVAVQRPSIESMSFARCVQSAGQRMRPSAGAVGGDARFSYTLAFGG